MIYISPNQIEKLRRCYRLIGYEYVEGIKVPSSPKQEFGTSLHAQIEQWLREGKLPDETPPGLAARQAIRGNWLPTPSKDLLVEHSWEFQASSEITFRGRIDCLVPPARDLPWPLVIDHKTTSAMRWAKTPTELQSDSQAIIYAVYAALKYSAQKVRARWIYYAASNPKTGERKPAGAKPVETFFDVGSEEFLRLWDELFSDAEVIAEIRTRERSGATLAAKPENCGAFGGCFFRDKCELSGLDSLEACINQTGRKK